MNRVINKPQALTGEHFMNQKYLYFITNANRTEINIGITQDLVSIAENCQNAPELFPGFGNTRSRLIYFEEYNDQQQLKERFTFLSRSTRAQKEKIIRKINPDWVDLSVGILHEGILSPRKLKSPMNTPGFNYN